MVKANFLTEQTIRDAFYLPLPGFINLYKQIIPEFQDMELKIIWFGIRCSFERSNKNLDPSNKLDPEKLALFKRTLRIELSDDEKELLTNGDPFAVGRDIMEDNLNYKWNSDKIKALLKEGYSDKEIIDFFNGKVTLSYIAQFKPKS